VGTVLGDFYYSHRLLNALFAENGAPGDPPEGSCASKATEWLKRANQDPEVDALELLGGVLEEFMEADIPRQLLTIERLEEQRRRVSVLLGKHGLDYRQGGRIFGGKTGAPTRSLESVLRARDIGALDVEFDRALSNVETDPPAAVTAACAIVEAFCKIYIEDENLELPIEQTVKPLWKIVQKHLGLDPAQLADDDLKRILTGLASVVDGLGAFRTHVGSAHGRGSRAYKPSPRHARLACHSAHTLVAFALETWDVRRKQAG
jgi:Abortive infection C-terminus